MEAQQYAQETDLSRRVRDWEDRILPVLSEEVSSISCKLNQEIFKLVKMLYTIADTRVL